MQLSLCLRTLLIRVCTVYTSDSRCHLTKRRWPTHVTVWPYFWEPWVKKNQEPDQLVPLSSVPWLIGSSGGHERRFSGDPLPVFFCKSPLWAVLAWAGMSTLWYCPSSISSADHSVTRCSEGWFWRGCHGVWHASFHLLTVARRDSCWPIRRLILLCTQLLVLCSKQKIRRSFLRYLVSKTWILFIRVRKQCPCFTAIE